MRKLYRRVLVWLLRLDPDNVMVTVISKRELETAVEWMNHEMFEPVKITESQDQVVH